MARIAGVVVVVVVVPVVVIGAVPYGSFYGDYGI